MGGLSSLTGGGGMSGGAGGASGAVTSTTTSGFNSSGWSVAFGSGSASTAVGTPQSMLLMAGLAVVALIAWKMSKK
jgi:hypothetical protein